MAQCPHGFDHPSRCSQCNPAANDARVYGIAVENGKNVVHLIINGSKVVIDTNIIGFATLAKHGVPVISVGR